VTDDVRRRRRHAHHARHAHMRAHVHAQMHRWRDDPTARGLWRGMSRLRVRVFLALAACVAGGIWVGAWMAAPGASPRWVVLAIGVALWLVTGALAFKLTRTFLRIVDAARAIGDGDLATRAEVLRSTGEFAVLGEAINDMATRLQRQVTDQKQLLAAVSHELRTPLGHLRILIDTARDQGAAPAWCDQLEREVLQLDALVARLLTSSRLDFATLERRSLDLRDLALDAARAAGIDAARVETVPADAPASATTAAVDATLLRSALRNLLDNGQHHGRGVVRVRVRADRDDGLLAVEVEDDGPGVPPDRQGELFAPFVASAGGGLGLGMALVARIAAAHGGRAWLEGRVEGGARAGFSVARALAPADAGDGVTPG